MIRQLCCCLFFFVQLSFTYAKQPFRVVFWNTENTFDIYDTPHKNDAEFMPESDRKWTFWRYRKKLITITQTLIAAGEGTPPALIGLCEIAGDSVMPDLQRLTPIYRLGYRYLITDALDERGINIALLYRRHQFKLLHHQPIRINLPKPYRPTRDILHVCGLISPSDTLDVFVCHFPSRYGGENATRKARQIANQTLRHHLDSIAQNRMIPRFLIMGDFNDYPNCANQTTYLHIQKEEAPSDDIKIKSTHPVILYNAMSALDRQKGSHKYNGRWGYLDQFIVSHTLMQTTTTPHISKARVFEAPFLLTDDTKYFGLRPKRTYYGYRYEAGASDHLPILIDILWK